MYIVRHMNQKSKKSSSNTDAILTPLAIKSLTEIGESELESCLFIFLINGLAMRDQRRAHLTPFVPYGIYDNETDETGVQFERVAHVMYAELTNYKRNTYVSYLPY